MPPVVLVVGFSNAGKTTFIEKLIQEMTSRGYRIGSIKHAPHGLTSEPGKKDDQRHFQAGAQVAVVVAPDRLQLTRRTEKEWDLGRVVAQLKDMDLVLVEGYKRSNYPRIEVIRSAVNMEIISPPEYLLAVVSDVRPVTGAPIYGMDDVSGVADLLLEKILKI